MSQCEILWWGIFELDIRGGLWAEPWIQINKVSFPAWICVRVRLFRGRAEDGRVGAINHTFCCRLRSEWMRRKTKHRKATSGVWVKNVVRSRLFIRGAEPRARLMLGWAFRNSSTTLLSRETTAKISRNQEEATQLEFAQWRNTRWKKRSRQRQMHWCTTRNSLWCASAKACHRASSGSICSRRSRECQLRLRSNFPNKAPHLRRAM